MGDARAGTTGALGECQACDPCGEGSTPRGRRRFLAAMGARYGLAGRYDEPARLRADCPTSMYFARPIIRARGRPP
jgi:hypothetical protein